MLCAVALGVVMLDPNGTKRTPKMALREGSGIAEAYLDVIVCNILVQV